jgi:hypothetical protein
MMRTSSLNDISTKQQKIAKLTRQSPSMIWLGILWGAFSINGCVME